MVMSLVFLVFSFALVHGYLIGEPFESWFSIFATFYLLVCTWAFPYFIKKLSMRYEEDIEKTGIVVFQGMSIVVYLIAPFIYFYLKYFDEKNDEEPPFSSFGLVMGVFFFLLTLPLLHIEWIGPFFGSLVSILVSIYLAACVWAFSLTFKELFHTIDFFLERPLGRIMLPIMYLFLYVLSPLIFFWKKINN